MTTAARTGSTPAMISSRASSSAVRSAHAAIKAFVKTYHRAEAAGSENVPVEGGALLVSNHSGGVLTVDVPVIASALWDTHGHDFDLRVLVHDVIMGGSVGAAFTKLGFLAANPANADAALRAGAATLVFPGGDWDACRPFSKSNVIDFGGRTGYVRTALRADVPIVPIVSIGGHEAQFILTRGESLAKAIPFTRLLRSKVAPVTVGFPFGVTIGLPQFPLPTKIVTQFLEPIHLRDMFGPDPDPVKVDELVRARMQAALDRLAVVRRLPILG
jgi:1-acyl-sn-glycerol-3-phosphate acyltransferase